MTALIASFLLGLLPMLLFSAAIYWLDRYEKEPIKLLVFVFLWGAIFAALVSFIINTLTGIGIYAISGSETAANFSVSSIIAPIVEEVTKGLAVLVVFLFFHSEFDSILDGIIYAAITALGFAASENVYYIYSMGYQLAGWQGLFELSFIRIILVGWQHPFYTAFFGIGLAFARLQRRSISAVIAPLAGLFTAILMHSLHNTISPLLIYNAGWDGLIRASRIDWLGWMLMFCFILLMIEREKKIMRIYLLPEIELTTLTTNLYQIACSSKSQRLAKLQLKNTDRVGYITTKRYFQLCAELAHKKHQLYRMGNEDGNHDAVLSIRRSLAELSPGIGELLK